MSESINYKPSVYYFRRALRGAATKKEAIDVGLTVVAELENLKAWVRSECGVIPPKRFVLACEAKAKGWKAQRAD